MNRTEEIKNSGLKATLPRIKILEIFQKTAQRHMTAEDVYKALLTEDADIGLATVYRVLMQFEAAGIVVKHNFEGGQAVFELDRGEHHDHMFDLDTGKVVEFFDAEIERLQHAVAAKFGYVIEDHRMVLYVRAKPKG